MRAIAEKQRRPLSDGDIRRFAALYTAQMLRADEAARRAGLTSEAINNMAEQLEEDLDDSRMVIRGRRNYFFEARRDAFLKKNGVDLDPDTDSYEKLAASPPTIATRDALRGDATGQGLASDLPLSHRAVDTRIAR